MNLRKFDLNLLVIFQMLLAKRSVVGAAGQVGLSPSAVSHALSRLRVMFNDELFRRTSQGLEPTDRALELSQEISAGLAHIANAIEIQHSFVPAESARTFTMQIADYVSGMLLPPLAKKLREQAPGVSVHVLPFAASSEAPQPIVDVQVRFTLGAQRYPAARAERLLTDRFVVIMRKGHPAAGEDLTPESYAALSHARLSPSAIGTTLIDDALARRGLRRRVVMTVPTWFDLPQIIENSDLVAIVPINWHVADTRLSELTIKELPLPEVSFAIDLCWDIRSERDPSQIWFRRTISTVFGEILRK